MTLPKRIPKKAKQSTRWKSTAHRNFVRSHACCMCGSVGPIEVAHVRIGSGAGMSQKPDDWRTVSLCQACHQSQHSVGERTFWEDYESRHQQTVDELVDDFAKQSPKAQEIRQAKRKREL